MKNLKYLFILISLALVVPSCVEDTAPEDAFGAGANMISFVSTSGNLSGIADGSEYDFEIPMRVKGPKLADVTAAVTATIAVDPAAAEAAAVADTTLVAAVEGTHFSMDTKSITFSPEGDLLGNLGITLLTAGIDAPLEKTPVLVLNVASVTGDDNLIADAKTITIKLLYLCPSELAGDYVVTITRNDGAVYVYSDAIAKTGDGQYRGTSVAHYAPGSIGGEPGFDFFDVCDVITVPEQNLVNLYSNLVYGIGSSYVQGNGDLHIEYEVTFAAGNRQYVCDYVKQ